MPVSFRQIWSPMRWPQSAVDSAPKPVRDSWAACEQATQAALDAGKQHRQAIATLGAADRDDHKAATEAVRAGRPVPESCKEQRRQAADTADRVRAAHEEVAISAERDVVRVARDHREQWMSELGTSLDLAVDHAEGCLLAVEQALADLWAMSATWRWLDAGKLDQQPRPVMPDDTRQALRAARESAKDATPQAIQQARAERAEQEAAELAAQPPSFAGIVLDAPGRRALAG